MLDKMLAHTHKITQLFLDKCPRKNPTWKIGVAAKGFNIKQR